MQVLGKLLCVDCGSNTNLFKVDHPTRRTYGNLCGDCIEKYEPQECDCQHCGYEYTFKHDTPADSPQARGYCSESCEKLEATKQMVAEEFAKDVEWERTHCDPDNEIDYYESHKKL